MKMKKRCFENWENMPYTSEHLWQADHHGQPFGGCRKCGYPVETWNQKCFQKSKIALRNEWVESAPRSEADNWQDMRIEEKIERLKDGVDELLGEGK